MKRYSMIYGSGGSKKMKIKIVGIFVCMLLILTLLPISTMAGDETDPEISDMTGDARMNVDIQKAWFFEDPATPEYLYITIQVTYLQTMYKGVLLNDVYWTMNNVTHFAAAGLGIYMSGVMGKGYFAAGIPWSMNWSEITGSLDVKNRTITCIIPKSFIGNPQKGDILTKTYATTSQRTPFMAKLGWDAYIITRTFRNLGLLSMCWMDGAPDKGYGRDYIIQY
jgi:hypothetical protein